MVDQTYLPNKTVTLKEDNLNTSNTPSSTAKTIVKPSDNYLSHKTVNLGGGIVSEKKEERIPEKKEEKPKEEQQNNANKQSPTPSIIDSKTNYPSNKTVNIGNEISSEKKEEKSKEEELYAPKNPAPPSVNIDSKNNYLSHKTIDLSGGTTSIRQDEKQAVINNSNDVKSTVIKDEQTKVQSTTTGTTNSVRVEKNADYAERKTVTVSKVESLSTDTTNNRKQITNNQSIINDKELKKNDYQKLKTVTITEEEKIVPKNEIEVKPISISDNKTESITSGTTSKTVQGNYPANKSFSFVKEETKNQTINPAKVEQSEAKITPVKKEDSTVKGEDSTVKGNIKPQTVIVQGKAKKPVLWIIVSTTLLLTTAAAGWYSYHQQNSFNGEIALLQQNNEDLTDSIKKLQKDKLHFDDLIIRGGKVDAKNNITVVESATESEAVRVCFSIASNQFAAKGKKAVYIRLIDANNNVLVKAKEDVFEYKRKQIPFSLMEEVEYKNQEMMVCFDFKPDEKLQPGNYKAEIYNDGVLDGIGTFELK